MNVVDMLVGRLFGLILDGTFGPGMRLPPERELATRFEVSRVSVRAAIKRLSEWQVVSARQGSGVEVRPRRAWTAGALPGVLARAASNQRWDELLPIIADALDLRRGLVLDLVARAAPRLSGADLTAARSALQAAWAARHDPRSFTALDREVLPTVLEAAGMDASLFLINSLSEAYLSVLATVVTGSIAHAGYLELNNEMLDALEAGDGERAVAVLDAQLKEVDRQIVGSFPAPFRRRIAKMRGAS